VDRHLQRYIDAGKIAGALTLITRRGELAHFQPLGLADREQGRPMARDTIFRIYSMTKPITSVALMMLYEQGLFQLDDPVHRHIPEWRDLRVFAGGNHPTFLTSRPERRMTVRDLLTHMSGLTYGFMERTNVDAAYRKLGIGGAGAEGTLRDMIEQLADIPLEFSPGTAWNYSVSTDVLGYLIEVISGLPFDRYLEEHVFAPLGMRDTAFWVPPDKLDRLSSCYTRGRDGGLRVEDPAAVSRYAKPRAFLSGGGGLVSTAEDYMRFCQMLLRGGELDGARLLGRKTIELMTSNHLPDNRDLTQLSRSIFTETAYQGVGFGLGFSVLLDPARAQVSGSAGEFAWGGAASTAFWIDPAEELAVVFLTQLLPSTTYNFRRELKALIYSAIVD
jgi:CubicO group peptidase (beta-lactamase class C family)